MLTSYHHDVQSTLNPLESEVYHGYIHNETADDASGSLTIACLADLIHLGRIGADSTTGRLCARSTSGIASLIIYIEEYRGDFSAVQRRVWRRSVSTARKPRRSGPLRPRTRSSVNMPPAALRAWSLPGRCNQDRRTWGGGDT
jgi:hypothetical protein